MTGLGPDARAVRAALTDARALCSALGLLDGYRPARQAGGLFIRCPVHRDRTPSCSVLRRADGTLSVKCFGCDWKGDALHLVAVARGLDIGTDFRAVVEAAAELAGGGTFDAASAPARTFAPQPLSYPPAGEVAALWSACLPLDRDAAAASYLATERALATDLIALLDLVRVLPLSTPCPTWAHVRGQPWSRCGYRLIVPVVDHTGEVRSLRAWGLPAEMPWEGEDRARLKRLAPGKYSTVGLVMACPVARQMLREGPDGPPLDVVVTEGEPDFLTNATHVSDGTKAPPAIIGVVSSAWSQAVADRIPEGSRVVIRTHLDSMGDRYAQAIKDSLNDRLVAVFDFPRGTKADHGQVD